MTTEPETYVCCRGGSKTVLHTKEAVWEWIGQSWAPYEVKDVDGNILEEFIPF